MILTPGSILKFGDSLFSSIHLSDLTGDKKRKKIQYNDCYSVNGWLVLVCHEKYGNISYCSKDGVSWNVCRGWDHSRIVYDKLNKRYVYCYRKKIGLLDYSLCLASSPSLTGEWSHLDCELDQSTPAQNNDFYIY